MVKVTNGAGGFFCVQLVFDMLVLQKHNMEMTVAAGEAFYTLVCLHQVNKQHNIQISLISHLCTLTGCCCCRT